jgi:hypothetical protein
VAFADPVVAAQSPDYFLVTESHLEEYVAHSVEYYHWAMPGRLEEVAAGPDLSFAHLAEI